MLYGKALNFKKSKVYNKLSVFSIYKVKPSLGFKYDALDLVLLQLILTFAALKASAQCIDGAE
jgi:hypothetical protein